jgi:hypothetical protein
MGKASIDDCLVEHPKFIAAGPEAGWMWLAGVLYARRALTDGFIPYAKVRTLVLGQKKPFSVADRLVNVGLWQREKDGFRVHDFFDHNPSKAQVQDYQRRDKERKQRTKQISFSQPVRELSDSETDHSRAAGATRAGAKYKSAYESTYESESGSGDLSEGVVGETIAPDANSPHWDCPRGALAACKRGICVPKKLYREWLGQFGDRDGAVSQISAFIDATLASIRHGPIGDKPWEFWRSAWEFMHESKALRKPKLSPKNQQNIDALNSFMAKNRESEGVS